MQDIPLKDALLLWNSGLNGGRPAFVVRPLGHDDYYDYDYQAGACMRSWHASDPEGRKLKFLVQIWHITAFYAVPADIMKEEMLRIPEYRAMLADDCIPAKFLAQREDETA